MTDCRVRSARSKAVLWKATCFCNSTDFTQPAVGRWGRTIQHSSTRSLAEIRLELSFSDERSFLEDPGEKSVPCDFPLHFAFHRQSCGYFGVGAAVTPVASNSCDQAGGRATRIRWELWRIGGVW